MTPAAAAIDADNMAGVIYRAAHVEPDEIRSEDDGGDPQGQFGRSIHARRLIR